MLTYCKIYNIHHKFDIGLNIFCSTYFPRQTSRAAYMGHKVCVISSKTDPCRIDMATTGQFTVPSSSNLLHCNCHHLMSLLHVWNTSQPFYQYIITKYNKSAVEAKLFNSYIISSRAFIIVVLKHTLYFVS